MPKRIVKVLQGSSALSDASFDRAEDLDCSTAAHTYSSISENINTASDNVATRSMAGTSATRSDDVEANIEAGNSVRRTSRKATMPGWRRPLSLDAEAEWSSRLSLVEMRVSPWNAVDTFKEHVSANSSLWLILIEP